MIPRLGDVPELARAGEELLARVEDHRLSWLWTGLWALGAALFWTAIIWAAVQLVCAAIA